MTRGQTRERSDPWGSDPGAGAERGLPPHPASVPPGDPAPHLAEPRLPSLTVRSLHGVLWGGLVPLKTGSGPPSRPTPQA